VLAVCWYLIQCGFFTEVHQKFLCSGHFLPCGRDFAFIGKKKKVSYLMVPSQLKYMVAESRINKPFTVVGIEQSHLDCKYSEAGSEPQNHPSVVVKIFCRWSCCSSSKEKAQHYAAMGMVQYHEAKKRKLTPSSTSTGLQTRGFTSSA
jgi:hypothetical protein